MNGSTISCDRAAVTVMQFIDEVRQNNTLLWRALLLQSFQFITSHIEKKKRQFKELLQSDRQLITITHCFYKYNPEAIAKMRNECRVLSGNVNSYNPFLHSKLPETVTQISVKLENVSPLMNQRVEEVAKGDKSRKWCIEKDFIDLPSSLESWIKACDKKSREVESDFIAKNYGPFKSSSTYEFSSTHFFTSSKKEEAEELTSALRGGVQILPNVQVISKDMTDTESLNDSKVLNKAIARISRISSWDQLTMNLDDEHRKKFELVLSQCIIHYAAKNRRCVKPLFNIWGNSIPGFNGVRLTQNTIFDILQMRRQRRQHAQKLRTLTQEGMPDKFPCQNVRMYHMNVAFADGNMNTSCNENVPSYSNPGISRSEQKETWSRLKKMAQNPSQGIRWMSGSKRNARRFNMVRKAVNHPKINLKIHDIYFHRLRRITNFNQIMMKNFPGLASLLLFSKGIDLKRILKMIFLDDEKIKSDMRNLLVRQLLWKLQNPTKLTSGPFEALPSFADPLLIERMMNKGNSIEQILTKLIPLNRIKNRSTFGKLDKEFVGQLLAMEMEEHPEELIHEYLCEKTELKHAQEMPDLNNIMSDDFGTPSFNDLLGFIGTIKNSGVAHSSMSSPVGAQLERLMMGNSMLDDVEEALENEEANVDNKECSEKAVVLRDKTIFHGVVNNEEDIQNVDGNHVDNGNPPFLFNRRNVVDSREAEGLNENGITFTDNQRKEIANGSNTTNEDVNVHNSENVEDFPESFLDSAFLSRDSLPILTPDDVDFSLGHIPEIDMSEFDKLSDSEDDDYEFFYKNPTNALEAAKQINQFYDAFTSYLAVAINSETRNIYIVEQIIKVVDAIHFENNSQQYLKFPSSFEEELKSISIRRQLCNVLEKRVEKFKTKLVSEMSKNRTYKKKCEKLKVEKIMRFQEAVAEAKLMVAKDMNPVYLREDTLTRVTLTDRCFISYRRNKALIDYIKLRATKGPRMKKGLWDDLRRLSTATPLSCKYLSRRKPRIPYMFSTFGFGSNFCEKRKMTFSGNLEKFEKKRARTFRRRQLHEKNVLKKAKNELSKFTGTRLIFMENDSLLGKKFPGYDLFENYFCQLLHQLNVFALKMIDFSDLDKLNQLSRQNVEEQLAVNACGTANVVDVNDGSVYVKNTKDFAANVAIVDGNNDCQTTKNFEEKGHEESIVVDLAEVNADNHFVVDEDIGVDAKRKDANTNGSSESNGFTHEDSIPDGNFEHDAGNRMRSYNPKKLKEEPSTYEELLNDEIDFVTNDGGSNGKNHNKATKPVNKSSDGDKEWRRRPRKKKSFVKGKNNKLNEGAEKLNGQDKDERMEKPEEPEQPNEHAKFETEQPNVTIPGSSTPSQQITENLEIKIEELDELELNVDFHTNNVGIVLPADQAVLQVEVANLTLHPKSVVNCVTNEDHSGSPTSSKLDNLTSSSKKSRRSSKSKPNIIEFDCNGTEVRKIRGRPRKYPPNHKRVYPRKKKTSPKDVEPVDNLPSTLTANDIEPNIEELSSLDAALSAIKRKSSTPSELVEPDSKK
ncbi:unnamed protein product [Caenorhabditis bovis]|nr:unnamed protein product [Caenorhabditis bovis]